MIACNICDIKLFTKKLFIGETFDRFLLKEAEIVTFNTFSIDGRVHKSFYSEEERAEGQIEEYSTWKTLRPFCFSLIKGKKLPAVSYTHLDVYKRQISAIQQHRHQFVDLLVHP